MATRGRRRAPTERAPVVQAGVADDATTPSQQPRIRVTEIGEYIRHSSCDRRFRLAADHRRLARQLPFAERLFSALDPVLRAAGRKRENGWEQSLKDAGLRDLTHFGERPTPWAEFVECARELEPGQDAYGREVSVEASLGAFTIEGRVDFVLLLWRDGHPRLRVVECKASRRDKTYQRIQVCLYRMIVRALVEAGLQAGPVSISRDDVDGVVARIDEATNQGQAILGLESLDLEMEEADLDRLLAAEGPLVRILASDLDSLPYRLEQKCDGCVFNIHCLPESARRLAHELLGLEPTAARALRAAGIPTIAELATLDLPGRAATAIRADPAFGDDIEQLAVKARARQSTLPGGRADPDAYEVEALPHAGQGQLPEHVIGGRRLVRVFLEVDYDYVENRLFALSAHVTASEGRLNTGFVQEGGRWRPDPDVKEQVPAGTDANGRLTYQDGALSGSDVVEFIPGEWTGRYEVDTGAEKQLIQGFLQKLVDAIAEVAAEEEAPIHFYVWSRSEITRLVEACSRVSSRLLGALRELLGCRESLEQLIFSSLQEEVDQRYALGWTGRGLGVVTSLRWFGRRYHWVRRVAGAEVALDRTFTQDVFDFKTDLDLTAAADWARRERDRATRHKFEIRSRFFDTLPGPYMHAFWRTLPDPDTVEDHQVAGAIRRYNEAARPGVLREYLRARTHALRWVEETVRFKNSDIEKPALRIADLPTFALGVDSAAQAAIDFLRLDQHVKVSGWIADHLLPPASRISAGRTIPLRDIRSPLPNQIVATIDLAGYDLDLAGLRARCSIGEGSFVRLTPCSPDPRRGQTIGQLLRAGKTCRVDAIDWDSGSVQVTAMWMRTSTRYVLGSYGTREPGDVFDYATIDESPSDFVAGEVEDRLLAGQGTHAFRWFDPESPEIPDRPALTPVDMAFYERLLTTLPLAAGVGIAPDQRRAVIEGLEATVQLLQGPPGTGKTMTSGVAILTRILTGRQAGDIVLLAAHTHTAVDTLLLRLDAVLDAFRRHAGALHRPVPPVTLMKVHSTFIGDPCGGRVTDIRHKPSATVVNQARQGAVLVIGGTTKAVLGLAEELSQRRPWRDQPGLFSVPTLVVDEASMMVFPHFLALATVIDEDGDIMLAGDNRQLAPILAHDWEREDRPPAVLYQPFASAYDAVLRIKSNPTVSDRALSRSALEFTFRLPPEIRELIARLYRLDDIQLEGLPRTAPGRDVALRGQEGWAAPWSRDSGLYLVLHSERESRESNATEADIIESILTAGGRLPASSVAVITPHRAQRALLKLRLASHEAAVDVIDTVERLQGNERPTVIVSATASDAYAIGARAEFLLDLNRSNVAFSRARDRLIVVCSETLLDHIAAELEHYQAALLWKSLRALCTQLVSEESVDGRHVHILTVPIQPEARPAPGLSAQERRAAE
jgi:hypothetical protein